MIGSHGAGVSLEVSHVTIRYHTRLAGNRDRGLFLATRDLTSHS
jgi:hypothetical protein